MFHMFCVLWRLGEDTRGQQVKTLMIPGACYVRYTQDIVDILDRTQATSYGVRVPRKERIRYYFQVSLSPKCGGSWKRGLAWRRTNIPLSPRTPASNTAGVDLGYHHALKPSDDIGQRVARIARGSWKKSQQTVSSWPLDNNALQTGEKPKNRKSNLVFVVTEYTTRVYTCSGRGEGDFWQWSHRWALKIVFLDRTPWYLPWQLLCAACNASQQASRPMFFVSCAPQLISRICPIL